jgi:hypothetical protein
MKLPVEFSSISITLRERAPGTHSIGWVGPRTGVDDVGRKKILPLPGLELRPLGRRASRYTECAIPALQLEMHCY